MHFFLLIKAFEVKYRAFDATLEHADRRERAMLDEKIFLQKSCRMCLMEPTHVCYSNIFWGCRLEWNGFQIMTCYFSLDRTPAFSPSPFLSPILSPWVQIYSIVLETEERSTARLLRHTEWIASICHFRVSEALLRTALYEILWYFWMFATFVGIHFTHFIASAPRPTFHSACKFSRHESNPVGILLCGSIFNCFRTAIYPLLSWCSSSF